MAADALSDLLRTVRLTGATFFNVVAKAPWVAEQAGPELILPKILPGAEHLIAYHAARRRTRSPAPADRSVLTGSASWRLCSSASSSSSRWAPNLQAKHSSGRSHCCARTMRGRGHETRAFEALRRRPRDDRSHRNKGKLIHALLAPVGEARGLSR